jgi:hypothetical protein
MHGGNRLEQRELPQRPAASWAKRSNSAASGSLWGAGRRCEAGLQHALSIATPRRSRRPRSPQAPRCAGRFAPVTHVPHPMPRDRGRGRDRCRSDRGTGDRTGDTGSPVPGPRERARAGD